MRLAVLMVAAWLGSGCAVHMPMSQAVVFSHETAGMREDLDVGFVGERVAGLQFAMGSAVADTTRKPNPRGRGGGLFFASYGSDNAVSMTTGLGVVGMDVTQRIVGPVYASVSGSFLGGAEALALAPIPSPSRRFGLSVGVGGRCRYDLRDDPDNDSEFVYALRLRSAWVCSAGGRATALWMYRPRNEKPLSVLGTVYIGASPVEGQPVVGFGVAAGLF